MHSRYQQASFYPCKPECTRNYSSQQNWSLPHLLLCNKGERLIHPRSLPRGVICWATTLLWLCWDNKNHPPRQKQSSGEKHVLQSAQYLCEDSALTHATELVMGWANPPWVPDVADGEGDANFSLDVGTSSPSSHRLGTLVPNKAGGNIQPWVFYVKALKSRDTFPYKLPINL